MPRLPADAASKLRTDLDMVQASALAHDAAGATRDLNTFAADVAAQHAAGHIASSDYGALQTGIGRARTRLAAEVTAPAPATPTPAPVTPVAPVAPQPAAPVASDSQGNGNDNGKGKGHGHGKGNGGD